MDDDAQGPRPGLRVVRGDASAEEIAALVAVVSRIGDEEPEDAGASGPASAWNDRAASMRRTIPPGPGAWRASGWAR